jgi:hypothetical protein
VQHVRQDSNSSLADYSREIHAIGRGPEKRRRWYQAKALAFGVRLALGIVFVYASVDKILNPAAFAQAVYNYQILPDLLINLTAIVLPWMELFPGATFLSTLLLVTFFGALLFNTARGLNIDCGCFSTTDGTLSGTSMGWYVLRDGGFLLLALYLFSHFFLKK